MSTERLPEGLPELQRGGHAKPEDGACLMEYVSVLAGEPFTDRPSCVDPLLVRLAWTVNDTAHAEVRTQLADLAPRFIGTATRNPLSAPAIVFACCSLARSYLPPAEQGPLARAQARAEARMRRISARNSPRQRRRGDRLYRDVYAESPLQASVRVLAAFDTSALPDLLRVALAAVAEVGQPQPALLEPAATTGSVG